MGRTIGLDPKGSAASICHDYDQIPLWGHVHMMSAQGGGGGGSTQKADIVRKLSKGGCVKMQTGGGSKNQEILQTSYVHVPYLGVVLRSIQSIVNLKNM